MRRTTKKTKRNMKKSTITLHRPGVPEPKWPRHISLENDLD
jgi:hypothetical protein